MNPIQNKTAVAALLAALAATPALADKGGKPGKGRHGHDGDRVVRVDRDHGDRYTHRYLRDRHHDDHVAVACPPGLAKKDNGCRPPGQAKKDDHRVIVGHPLPPGAVYTVPRRVRATLPPPPYGYRYAVVNQQVVLVSETNVVVEILRSLLG